MGAEPVAASGVPILMWHHVGEAPTAALRPYAVAPDLLEAQLDALVGAGCEAVTFDDLRAGRHVPRPVVLTFDDGYTSFVEAAAPLLEARGMRAVLFLVAGSLGGVNDWDKGAAALTLLDDDQVWQAARDGHELAVHAWRHRPLPEVPTPQLERELLAARAALEALGERAVRSLSYPHGRADHRVVAVAEGCGFDLACLDSRGPDPGWPPGLGLRRIDVSPATSPDVLLGELARNGVDVAPLAEPDVDAFGRLVRLTLAAAGGRPPAAGWGAVHAVAQPLAEVLRVREAPAQRKVFASTAHSTLSEAAPLAAALAPLAHDLDARLDAREPVPVWDVATPTEAAVVHPEAIRLAPRLSDPARLLWEMKPSGHAAAIGAYLGASGLRQGRRAVREGLEELTLAETALLAREALEVGEEGVWDSAESAFRRVRAGRRSAPRAPGERGLPAVRRFAVALAALVRRDVRERYGGSFVGVGWSIASPLLRFAVLAVFFGKVVRIDVPRFPEFLIAGLLPWMFLQRAISEAAGSVRGKGGLLRFSAFPRSVLPLAGVASASLELLGQLALIGPLLALGEGPPALRLLALLPAVAVAVALATGCALVAAGLSVQYRDFANLVPVLLALGFYAVPVVYPPTMVPAGWRTAWWLNPAAVVVAAFRSVLYGGPWPPGWAMATTAVTVALGAGLSWRWYARASDRFVARA